MPDGWSSSTSVPPPHEAHRPAAAPSGPTGLIVDPDQTEPMAVPHDTPPAGVPRHLAPAEPPPSRRRRRRMRRAERRDLRRAARRARTRPQRAREVARIVAAWLLVLPAAAWLGVRAAGVGAGTWVETVIVLTPYVALASVAVLAVVAALRVRPAILAAAGVCVGFGAIMAAVFVPGPRPSAAPTGPELRVMTVNVQFGWADADQIVRLVDGRDIDVLGVQEITPEFEAELREAGLSELLPHGVVEAVAGAEGTALYSRHRVRPVTDGIVGTHRSPSGLLSVPDAPPLFVSVVHPVPPIGEHGRDEWAETLASLPRPGARLDAAELAPDEDADRVDLLLGDFNATVDQPTFRGLLEGGYVDAAGAVGRGWKTTWRFDFTPPLAIDHVLVDEATDVRDVAVHRVAGSDHRAVSATLRLPAG